MKEKMKKLFVDFHKTPFEIAEMFQVSQEEVLEVLQELGFHNISARKYYLLKATPFSKEQREFILGSLMGTGQLKKYGKRSDFYLHIEEESKNVILWKKYHLANFVNVVNHHSKYWFDTVAHNELNTLQKKTYDNNKKVISEDLINHFSALSLSVLFLDRARVQSSQTLRFNTHNFSLSDHEHLQRILKVNFGLNTKVCGYSKNNIEYHYLSVNKRNTEILMKIIQPFIQEILRD